MIVVRRLVSLLALFFIALGVFFAAAKFNVPWYGSNDFRHYSLMVETPFSAESRAPFGYRVVTPAVAHVIWRSGLFYAPKETPFKDAFSLHEGVRFSGDILNALIFTNFMMLVGAAFILTQALRLSPGGGADAISPFSEVMWASMIFMSFSTVVFGFAGITEGGTLLFVSLLLFLHRAKMQVWFFVVVIISAFQRELISVVMMVYLLSSGARRNRPYVLAALISFFAYASARIFLPLPGHEDQLQLSSYLQNFSSFSVDRDFFLQVVVAQNIVWAFLALIAVYHLAAIREFVPYFCVLGVLFVLSVGTDIGPNAGRILNIALPIFLITLGEVMVGMSSRRSF